MNITVNLNAEGTAVTIIDQTLLPNERKFLRLTTPEEVWEAIKKLRVRGAPAIGLAAAMGLAAHMNVKCFETREEFFAAFFKVKEYFSSVRPTAVNLHWALERMRAALERSRGLPLDEVKIKLLNEARLMEEEDTSVCRSIGEHGADLLKPGMGVLTHCNAGALAASQYGTALAPIYIAKERGVDVKVFADETRPLLQGARLTAYELFNEGVDTTLICDNMVSSVMSRGWIDIVFVGCDRVAANGDTANKIGTSGVAILAAAYGIPFYVCAPFSTIDFGTPTGKDITIEERDPAEITDLWYEKPMVPKGIKVCNPAFDVTPNGYITGFITERGIKTPRSLS